MTSRREQRDRAERALRLRAMRRTWDEVADACGYRSRQAAHLAVKRLLDSLAPDPNAERGVTSESLRLLEARLWRQYARADDAGDAETMLKISKEIRSLSAESSKLNGLYRPVEHAVEVTVSQSPREIVEQARRATLESMSTLPILEGEVIQ